jgi:hypothetical protein
MQRPPPDSFGNIVLDTSTVATDTIASRIVKKHRASKDERLKRVDVVVLSGKLTCSVP